jgi:methylsterol monooxygenase
VAVAAVLTLTCAFTPDMCHDIMQHGGRAFFWLALAFTAFNPMPLLPPRMWGAVVPFVLLAWIAVAAGISNFGDPMVVFEWCWRTMTERFSVLQMAVWGSAIVHACLTVVLNIHPVIVQNLRHLQPYKIQQDKPTPSVAEWRHCLVHIVMSQLFVQLPLITGQYFFIKYFEIPVDYESIPSCWSLLLRVYLSLVVDDTWVYFGHRALHDRRIYKYIHKVHHTYTSPFAPDAEYEHPIETVVLGIGFFLACCFFTNHLFFMWVWLYARLVVTYDSHSGYDWPMNILHLMPFYNGAREHDWHHQYFNGMYAPTFTWWDRIFGTNAGFLEHQKKRLEKEAQEELKAEAAAKTAGAVKQD